MKKSLLLFAASIMLFFNSTKANFDPRLPTQLHYLADELEDEEFYTLKIKKFEPTKNLNWQDFKKQKLTNSQVFKAILPFSKNQINVKNQEEETPLHIASNTENIRIAVLLIKNGADMSIKNIKGRAAFDEIIINFTDYRFRKEKKEIHDIRENLTLWESGTLLHWAAIFGETERVEFLFEEFENSINVNILNKHKETPLDYAIELQEAGIDRTAIIHTLREHGAKTDYELDGRTPYAKEHLRER